MQASHFTEESGSENKEPVHPALKTNLVLLLVVTRLPLHPNNNFFIINDKNLRPLCGGAGFSFYCTRGSEITKIVPAPLILSAMMVPR